MAVFTRCWLYLVNIFSVRYRYLFLCGEWVLVNEQCTIYVQGPYSCSVISMADAIVSQV